MNIGSFFFLFVVYYKHEKAVDSMKNVKKKIATSVAVGTVAVAGYMGICEFFYNTALRKNKKKFLESEQNESILQEDEKIRLSEELIQWRKDSAVEDVEIEAFDHIRLHAEKITNHPTSKKWVIMVHGYSSCGSDMSFAAKHFDQNKYNVILMDCRGHGLSQGNYIGMGWHDRLDMISWINEIVAMHKDAEIVLYGLSMGAATVMMTCGETLPSNVKCAIEDCGYSSVPAIMDVEMKRFYNMPSALLLPGISALCKFHAHYSLYEASSVKQLKKSVTPMLFIHGESDDFVPYEMVFDCYNACRAEKELYTVAYSKHAESCFNPRYFERIFMFCDRYIGL